MNFIDFLRQQEAQRAAATGIYPMQRRAMPSQQASLNVSQGIEPQTVMPIDRPRAAPMMIGQPRVVGAMPTGGYIQGKEAYGPPMPAAFQVRGYSKGLADAGPDAQAYADQFAGGDLSKVRARLVNIDGEMKNDYYTRGLLDGPMPQGPVAPDASSGGYGPPQPDLWQRLFGGLFSGGA